MLNKANNGSYRKGNVLVVHYTEAEHGTLPRRVKTICGQSHRNSYFHVMEAEAAAKSEVNCQKCLAKAAAMESKRSVEDIKAEYLQVAAEAEELATLARKAEINRQKLMRELEAAEGKA